MLPPVDVYTTPISPELLQSIRALSSQVKFLQQRIQDATEGYLLGCGLSTSTHQVHVDYEVGVITYSLKAEDNDVA